jgi:chromosome segregation ATPase
LQQEVCAKWFQLQREQSLRVQESVFMHQQDCQQLRYELEVLRGKEDLMQCPVDSELVLAAPAHLRQENDDLRGQLARLAEENGRLAREGEGFKRKMGEIEAKTAEVRQSNDKLYEYIFDLEQKVAYYQEEIPKISQRAREESQQLL